MGSIPNPPRKHTSITNEILSRFPQFRTHLMRFAGSFIRGASVNHTQITSCHLLGAVYRRRAGRRLDLRVLAAKDGAMAGSELLSVAPMMDYTDVCFRGLTRLLTRHTWLYTEMVVDKTLIFNPETDRFLWFPENQHPIACQLGGSDPETLAKAAKIAAKYGYDEINLNCGCPSDRVAGAGCFGAALMLNPDLVARCMKAMGDAVDVPVTVKCRLGVDDCDSYEELCTFIRAVSENSSVRHFILHARKCMLNGLSPHQNRTIPPLRHEWVYALRRDFPHLEFSLNGGVKSVTEARSILDHRGDEGLNVRSVMIGRAAYEKPWQVLGSADTLIYGQDSNPAPNRRHVLTEYAAFADSLRGKWGSPKHPSLRVMVKPILNLFHGDRGCKKWKQAIDATIKECETLSELVKKTMHAVPDEVLDAPPAEGEPVTYVTQALPVLQAGNARVSGDMLEVEDSQVVRVVA